MKESLSLNWDHFDEGYLEGSRKFQLITRARMAAHDFQDLGFLPSLHVHFGIKINCQLVSWIGASNQFVWSKASKLSSSCSLFC